MSPQQQDDLPVFVKWMEFLKWLLPATEKFPRRVRFTFANRLDTLALDLVEDLVEARYSRDKREILKRANLRLEKIRILLRLCHQEQFLSHDAFEFAIRGVNEAWMAAQEQAEYAQAVADIRKGLEQIHSGQGIDAVTFFESFCAGKI